MLKGRRIWVLYDNKDGRMVYSCRVQSVKRFLPAGPVAHGEPASRDSHRSRHLVQLFTDTGMRTLTVGSIQLKNPDRVAAGKAAAAARKA